MKSRRVRCRVGFNCLVSGRAVGIETVLSIDPFLEPTFAPVPLVSSAVALSRGASS